MWGVLSSKPRMFSVLFEIFSWRWAFPLLLLWNAIPVQAQPGSRPNFVVIVTDDQNVADLEVMPKTRAHLFDKGIRFDKGYVTTPWCCPSRATIFTGLYTNHHLVVGNSSPLSARTVAQEFHSNGYFTGIVGKYLNSWDGQYRPEFNYWRVFRGGNVRKINPIFNENGTFRLRRGHIVKVMKRYLIDYLDLVGQQSEPFLLYWTPNLPHRPAIPEKKYRSALSSYDLPVFPNAGCTARTDKPKYIRDTPCVKPTKRAVVHRNQLRVLLSVDDTVDLLVKTLEQKGLLENTVIFFISDNGLMRSAFGLSGKPYPYENNIRVPFAMRYDRMKIGGQSTTKLVGNYDIAPTMYDLAGINPPYTMDGRSLVSLLHGAPTWRETLLFESFTEIPLEGTPKQPFVGITDGRYTLIVNRGDIPEFYDLLLDPYQLTNAWQFNQQKARELFERIRAERPDVTSEVWLTSEVKAYLGVL